MYQVLPRHHAKSFTEFTTEPREVGICTSSLHRRHRRLKEAESGPQDPTIIKGRTRTKFGPPWIQNPSWSGYSKHLPEENQGFAFAHGPALLTSVKAGEVSSGMN